MCPAIFFDFSNNNICMNNERAEFFMGIRHCFKLPSIVYYYFFKIYSTLFYKNILEFPRSIRLTRNNNTESDEAFFWQLLQLY